MKIKEYLSEIDYGKIEKGAEKLHKNATKEGSVKIDGEKYYFSFINGEYVVTDSKDNEITRFNTRKLPQAKKWLKEFLEN
jgi:hypothetical protein